MTFAGVKLSTTDDKAKFAAACQEQLSESLVVDAKFITVVVQDSRRLNANGADSVTVDYTIAIPKGATMFTDVTRATLETAINEVADSPDSFQAMLNAKVADQGLSLRVSAVEVSTPTFMSLTTLSMKPSTS